MAETVTKYAINNEHLGFKYQNNCNNIKFLVILKKLADERYQFRTRTTASCEKNETRPFSPTEPERRRPLASRIFSVQTVLTNTYF